MNNKRQIVLGTFFVLVLGILSYYTLFLTDFSLFKERTEMVVHFPDANALRTGDAVLVAGIRQGRVKAMSFDPAAELARRVTVTLRLDQAVTLREGFVIRIADATLLGGKNVEIDPGPSDAIAIPAGTVLFGSVWRGALASVGEFVDKNSAAIERIVTNVEAAVVDVRAGKGVVGKLFSDEALGVKVADTVDKVQTTFDNVSTITTDVKAGKGVVGRLIYDADLEVKLQEISTRLKEIGDNLSAITGDAQAGKGTVGRLLKDEELSADVAAAVKSLREVSDKINAGLIDDIRDIAAKIKSGTGTVGELIYSDELYTKAVQIADDLAVTSDALRNGQGSLGKLVFSSDLYDQVSRALDIVTRALEEYRESAPVTTFTSVLFGAF